MLVAKFPFRRWSCNPAHISGAPFNQCLNCVCFPRAYIIIPFDLTNVIFLFTLLWKSIFWKSQWIVAKSISHLLTSPWFNDELLFQEPAPIVHFPRILQCHFNDLCCAFSSQTSWVWGIMTPIGSESRSDMMVGSTFHELCCLSFDDPVTWCHA